MIDVTTTEVADLLIGGVLPCTEDRFGAIARTGVPYVGSVGALDMVNFGALDTVPERYPRPQPLRPQPAGDADAHHGRGERARSAAGSATRLDACEGPVRFLLPEGGVSLIDAPGKPFHDPAADAALFAALEATLRPRAEPAASSGCRLPINDPEFAAALVRAFREVASLMPRFARAELMERFQAMAARREPIIGGGAGTGLSARCEQAGGIDLIVIYNSGRYRMAGRGSLAGLLAYGNANEIVVEMGREVLPVAPRTPVLAGVNGTDPFMLRDHFLGQLAAMGFSGIQNFPTVGLIDGTFRQGLEETGMGYGLEIELVRAARQQDLLTTPYVFEPAQAAAMAEAGADILVPHMGLTTGGDIGASTALRLEDCPALIDAMAEAARAVRPDILVLCHGGPIATPEDATWILQHTRHCHGFYGASSMERLPTEQALTATTRAFKSIRF